MNSKTVTIFFILPYLFISIPTFAKEEKRMDVGILVAWASKVYLYHEHESIGIDVTKTELVYPGDLIVATKGASAKIVFNDDTILIIDENSRVKIKDYLILEKERKRVALLKLIIGKLRALVSNRFAGEGSTFQIETITVVAEVRKADFIIASITGGKEIVTLNGEVFLRSASPLIPGEVVIKSGFGIIVEQGRGFTIPAKVPEERLKGIIDETAFPATLPIVLTEAECIRCHQNTYLTMTRQKFVHPGALKDCKMCHIKQVKAKTEKEIPVETYTLETLVFLDTENNASYIVRVRVKDREGKEAVSDEARFTPSKLTTKMINDNIPPRISNLRVLELREGVFYTAVLAWETDKFCTSAAEYGLEGGPVKLFPMSDQYTRNHRITFTRLMSSEHYVFRVISKDPFGNISKSGDLKVETKNPITNKKDPSDLWPYVEDVNVVKVGNEIALRWKTNKETIGVVDQGEVLLSEKPPDEPHYPGFADLRHRGLYGCLSEGCHKGNIHTKTFHPIGTLSWRKARIPSDLPLLEGPVMLCVTCHTPHGGERNYRLRKEEKTLCASCH
jgi:predicted CXXCH cytochrome family protein